MIDWDSYRADRPHIAAGVVWLQHAGITPLCGRVLRAGQQAMDQFATQPAASYRTLWYNATTGARQRVADFLGCDAAAIALVKNTSQGLIFIAESLAPYRYWLPSSRTTGSPALMSQVKVVVVIPTVRLSRTGPSPKLVTGSAMPTRLAMATPTRPASSRARIDQVIPASFRGLDGPEQADSGKKPAGPRPS